VVHSRKWAIDAFRYEDGRAVAPIRVRLIPVSFKSNGEKAIGVEVSEVTSYSVHDCAGNLHRVRYKQHFRDEWHKGTGQWRLANTFYPGVPSRIEVDGHPVSYEELIRLTTDDARNNAEDF
jgi:hypothetical protein